MNTVHLIHVSNQSKFKLPDKVWVTTLGPLEIGEYLEGKTLSETNEWAKSVTDMTADIENSASQLLQE